MPATRRSLHDQAALTVLPKILEQKNIPDGGAPDPEFWEKVMRTAHAAASTYMRIRRERAERIRGSK